jgi:hypothetical protein
VWIKGKFILTDSGKPIIISKKIKVNAEIYTGKIRLFTRIMSPFSRLINIKKGL